jgi:hypothetical protein
VTGNGRPGRPEAPLNPAAGAAAKLAAELRQLRDDAGRPSYRKLARTAFYSHSALSQAAGGRELPSLAVTLAFAEACGGDRREWTARWQEAAEAARMVPAAEAAPAPDTVAAPDTAPARDRMADAGGGGWLGWDWLGRGWLGGGWLGWARGGWARRGWARRGRWPALAAAALAGGLLWWGISSLDGIGMAPTQHVIGGLDAPVADGDPPSVGDCGGWTRQLGRSPVQGDGTLLGMVQLRYSMRCGDVWARFDPQPALSSAGTVTVTLEVIRRSDGKTMVSSERYDGHPQRSDVLILHAGCAQAKVTIIRLHQIVATAATGCQSPP